MRNTAGCRTHGSERGCVRCATRSTSCTICCLKIPAETQLRQIDILCRSMEYIRDLERRKAMSNGDVIPPVLIVKASQKPSNANSTAPSMHSEDEKAETSDMEHTPQSSPEQSLNDFDQDCSSPESCSGVPRRKVLPHRVAINAHMRKRSRQMRKAFDTLRQLVPVHPGEPHLDKASILRRASQYVSFLDQLLREQAASRQQRDGFPLALNQVELSTPVCGVSTPSDWSLDGWDAAPAQYAAHTVAYHQYQPAPVNTDLGCAHQSGYVLCQSAATEQGFIDQLLDAQQMTGFEACASQPVFSRQHVSLHYPVITQTA